MILHCRKRPIDITAMLWDGTRQRADEIIQWSDGQISLDDGEPCMTLRVRTMEGVYITKPGVYILRGIRGEFYPCDSDVFDQSYDVIGGEHIEEEGP